MTKSELMATYNFPATSRYYGLATRTLTASDGRVIRYLERRFVPLPSQFALVQTHRVREGERLDRITAQYLNDPQQFWRICDANGVLNPTEAEVPGRTLRITLPQGVPATPIPNA